LQRTSARPIDIELIRDQILFTIFADYAQTPVNRGPEHNTFVVISVISEKLDPAGRVSLCAHHEAVIPRSKSVEPDIARRQNRKSSNRLADAFLVEQDTAV
jgi:hypothetical protein